MWSLYLGDGLTLTEVVRSSNFPKNTLSRAVNKVATLGLIDREIDPSDQRRVTLTLTEKGRAAVVSVKELMLEHERAMLECLSPAERLTLSDLLTKMVVATGVVDRTAFTDSSAFISAASPVMAPETRTASGMEEKTAERARSASARRSRESANSADTL